jgi:hypothetical protein
MKRPPAALGMAKIRSPLRRKETHVAGPKYAERSLVGQRAASLGIVILAID